jgi:hypothetical protein
MTDNSAGLNSPGGSASPGSEVGTRRVVENLDEAECRELLSTATIGRLVYTSRFGQVALPFEYKMQGDSLVFRTYRNVFTEEDLRTGIPDAEYDVAVEVDQIDPEARLGWMVLVWGPAHHVDSDAERASIINIAPGSWIEGEPEHFIRVNPIRIGGQRLRQA